MPANLNPRVTELLAWHGHSSGGVHVPFQSRSNPLGRVIETPLVRRLRALAAGIAADAASTPRWIFLVGGPGNGKSETIQDFLVHLDAELALGGILSQLLTQRFSPTGILPRKVEIRPAELGTSGAQFGARVARLVIVQDATATETALGNAASELAHDIADLLTSPETQPMPVFVACANRGLLARAMNEAYYLFGEANEVTQLLANVIQASSLGRETLAGRKPCWPLEADSRFACWPLDVESLLPGGPGPAPFEQMLIQATAESQWESPGRCADCSSREICPFRKNSEWLREDATRKHLLTVLRHGELAVGQRWNFRDAFSLIAELMIGQWGDFADASHPCDWVHASAAAATCSPPDPTSVLGLAAQLYPHAMFRGGHVRQAARAFLESRTIDSAMQPLTFGVLSALGRSGDEQTAKSIRETLTRDYLRLDPAISTPQDPAHALRLIEDAFCLSVEQGRLAAQQSGNLSSVEDLLLDIFQSAEGEWDLLGRDSATAVLAVCLSRKLAAMIAKRSIGIRLAHHALDDLLADYEACLHDGGRLAAVRTALQPLLGEPGFFFNLVEILGQPTAEHQPLVALQGQAPGVRALPAPNSTESGPGHDVPCIEVTDPRYRIPLTFDFYMALSLRKAGCAGSSLPASVRAALDRLRHRHAGELCRNEDRFVDGRASISLGTTTQIGVAAPGASPGLMEG